MIGCLNGFRLQSAQSLLYICSPSWYNTAQLVLRRTGWLGFDKPLFLLQQENMDLTGLRTFYSSVLLAWQTWTYDNNDIPGMWIFASLQANLTAQVH